jgi:hypothetical protein
MTISRKQPSKVTRQRTRQDKTRQEDQSKDQDKVKRQGNLILQRNYKTIYLISHITFLPYWSVLPPWALRSLRPSNIKNRMRRLFPGDHLKHHCTPTTQTAQHDSFTRQAHTPRPAPSLGHQRPPDSWFLCHLGGSLAAGQRVKTGVEHSR